MKQTPIHAGQSHPLQTIPTSPNSAANNNSPSVDPSTTVAIDEFVRCGHKFEARLIAPKLQCPTVADLRDGLECKIIFDYPLEAVARRLPPSPAVGLITIAPVARDPKVPLYQPTNPIGVSPIAVDIRKQPWTQVNGQPKAVASSAGIQNYADSLDEAAMKRFRGMSRYDANFHVHRSDSDGHRWQNFKNNTIATVGSNHHKADVLMLLRAVEKNLPQAFAALHLMGDNSILDRALKRVGKQGFKGVSKPFAREADIICALRLIADETARKDGHVWIRDHRLELTEKGSKLFAAYMETMDDKNIRVFRSRLDRMARLLGSPPRGVTGHEEFMGRHLGISVGMLIAGAMRVSEKLGKNDHERNETIKALVNAAFIGLGAAAGPGAPAVAAVAVFATRGLDKVLKTRDFSKSINQLRASCEEAASEMRNAIRDGGGLPEVNVDEFVNWLNTTIHAGGYS